MNISWKWFKQILRYILNTLDTSYAPFNVDLIIKTIKTITAIVITANLKALTPFYGQMSH